MNIEKGTPILVMEKKRDDTRVVSRVRVCVSSCVMYKQLTSLLTHLLTVLQYLRGHVEL